MKRLEAALERIFHHVKERDYDEVIAIVGDEGVGKTNVGLHVIEWWLRKLYGKVEPEDAEKYIALDSPKFASVLHGLKQYEPALHDEAADLSARGAMSKVNKLYTQAYQIIRGDNLLTVLILPSLFDLDPFFRKRRVRHMILVYGRGRMAFWSKSRLRKMVEYNERLPYKNYFVMRPTFYDTFPKYKGPLLAKYQAMKKEKMQGVRKWLYHEMKNLGDPDAERIARDEKVLKYLDMGMTQKQAAEMLGVTTKTVQRVKKRYS